MVRPVDSGRELVLRVADENQERLVRATLGARPVELLPEDARGAAPGLESDGCHRFRVATGGRALEPDALVSRWGGAVQRAGHPSSWLLEPVEGSAAAALGLTPGIAGLRSLGDRLEICVHRPVPDWSARLRHPALWAGGAAPAGAVRIRHDAENGESPFALAIVYGRQAGELIDGELPWKLERAPGWDKVYALRFDPQARWVNDPQFRHWIGGELSRDELLRLLFDGRGDPMTRLDEPGSAGSWSRRPRPFGSGSAPRFELRFDVGDRHASSIAARIKAVLARQRVRVDLLPRDAVALGEELVAGRYGAALIAHHPPLDDPVLALMHTLAPFGRNEELEAASRLREPAARSQAARRVEQVLLADARLVPLIRLHAWLARDPALERVAAGPYGVLHLDRARWRR